MDLPEKQYYGVRCPVCPAIYWTPNKQQIELLCMVSFKDKGLPYVEENLGLVVGYSSRFKHTCRPDLD